MTSKEITLNYLKNIMRNLKNAIELTKSEHSKIALETECSIIDSVITIVEGAEGE